MTKVKVLEKVELQGQRSEGLQGQRSEGQGHDIKSGFDTKARPTDGID
jgi:hypothetical protein